MNSFFVVVNTCNIKMDFALEKAMILILLEKVTRFRVDLFNLDSPSLQHDELADSLPCAEGEFIFLRLNVLREVCSNKHWDQYSKAGWLSIALMVAFLLGCSIWKESSPWPACRLHLMSRGVLMTGSLCASLWEMTSFLTCHH